MEAGSERYVMLASGLALPVEPVNLLLGLEARGFSLTRDGDHIFITPFSKLTDSDKVAIKQWKRHLLALIDYATETVM